MSLLVDARAAFVVLFACHAFAAFQSPIQDCDETFNFWEPSHYLNHGYGMQTWELSPDYAIRSWLYAALHSMAIYAMAFATPARTAGKSTQFYSLRLALAFISAVCESRLFAVISRSMNRRVALIFLVICSSAAGMFHASVSYLPSSFAMYTTTLALADFMDRRSGVRTSRGITWLGFGAIVGWPFVAALAAPFVLEDLFVSWLDASLVASLHRMGDGIAQSLLILILQMGVDSLFYRKITSVPFNIVRYNVLSRSGKGPDIYGIEPWHFYIRNLLINFNLWFVLALVSLPLLLLHGAVSKRPTSRLGSFRTLVFLCPFYLWCAIFTLQPHKEERFMYPIYTCLALNAAVSLNILISNISDPSPSPALRFIPATLRLYLVAGVILSGVVLGAWRIAGLATAYSAPLMIYRGLHYHPLVTQNADNVVHVCLGKEWYRYPSSYHIPSNVRLGFFKSDFDGLLPGAFNEEKHKNDFYSATWRIPEGMNDENMNDPAKYSDLAQCHFLVDSSFPGSITSKSEPDYVSDSEVWERVECLRFLDAQKTGMLGRLFWIPDFTFIPEKWRRTWGAYCLLSRRQLPR